MICENCGTQNEDNAKCCKKCGMSLSVETPVQEEQVTAETPVQEEQVTAEAPVQGEKVANDATQPSKKSKLVKIVVIAALAVVLAIIFFVVIFITAFNKSRTINLNKYLIIETTGCDGYGYADATIDWDAIEEKYGRRLNFTSKAEKEYGKLSYSSPEDALESYVSVSLDQYDNLSNGMKISYTWDIDEDLRKYLNCRVKYKDSSYTVEGLEEVDTFDAFADLTVSFTGTAPAGYISMEYTGSELDSYYFYASKEDGLSNGDTVTVSIDIPSMASFAQSHGKVPASLEKDYTVEGLAEYINSYSDVTEDFLSQTKSEAEDTIYSYMANYGTEVSLSDLQYAGYVFETVKDADGDVGSYNILYLIYTGTVSHSEGKFNANKIYFPVKFSGIMLADGVMSYTNNAGLSGYTELGYGWYSIEGYNNPILCYMDIVETNRERYTAECGDGFEVYSDYETISKLSDISEEYRQTLYADAQDKILSYIASSYADDSSATNLAVKGEYLLMAKNQGTDFRNNNRYIVVYSATVSNSENMFATTTVYFPVEYDGIVKLPGNEYLISEDKGIQGNSGFDDSWYSTKGYIDGTKMYSDLITTNRQNYTYEVSDGLAAFGN